MRSSELWSLLDLAAASKEVTAYSRLRALDTNLHQIQKIQQQFWVTASLSSVLTQPVFGLYSLWLCSYQVFILGLIFLSSLCFCGFSLLLPNCIIDTQSCTEMLPRPIYTLRFLCPLFLFFSPSADHAFVYVWCAHLQWDALPALGWETNPWGSRAGKEAQWA